MDIQSQNSTKPLAVITGASSGIGYELAKVFAKNGFDLLIASSTESIVEVADRLRGFGTHVEGVIADLATFEGVEKLYTKITSMDQPVDSLVLNAGVGVSGEFAETDLRDELNLIHLNVVSTVHLAKRVLQNMLAQHHGRILITSSIAAEMPGPYYAVYAASKAFVQSFAEALRYELKDKGVTVTSLQPGATDTAFFERAGMEDTKAATSKKDDPADVAQDGFDALMAGQDHVVAGSFMNKVQTVVGKLVSEQTGAALHARSTKPGSGHH